MPPTATATEPNLTARFRHKRRAGLVGVGVLLAGALLSLAEPLSRLLPPTALALVGWTGLALILWASVCPACGGAIALGGDKCVSCMDPPQKPTAWPRKGWRHLPVFGRTLVWMFAATIAVVALLSLAGAD
jgi:hypothetical protein